MHPAAVEALDHVLGGEKPASLESQVLDFKTDSRTAKETLGNLAHAAACFANARGGVLVVGVEDGTSGPQAVVGSVLDANEVMSRIYELTEPSLNVLAEVYPFQGQQLVVITVPPSPDVHQVAGRATERVGRTCQTMSPSRIASVLADRRGDDWSSKDSGRPITDTSPAAEEAARHLLSQAADGERRTWASLDWPDVCSRLGVAVEERLTNAGALLFVNTGRTHFQYTHRAANVGLIGANEVVSGTGIVAVTRVLELIGSRADRRAMIMADGSQLLLSDLPETAVREAVVNAFMHRDYRSEDHTRIEHHGSTLRITSPGGFMPGVTENNILTVSSRCRNLALATASRSLTLAESAGVGVDRMYATMTSVGHEPPSITSDRNTVETRLDGGPPNEPLVRFVATLPENRRGDPETLLILRYLLSHRTVTARNIAGSMQRTPHEAEARLLALSAPGTALIERTPDTAHSAAGQYRLVGDAIRELGAAVTYRARSGSDTDRKIIAIVEGSGMITGRVVQQIFDVQPATASRILADLVSRGVLAKTSTAQRGPAVTYGPGPRFP